MYDLSRRDFLSRMAKVGGLWPLADEIALREACDADREWCLHQETAILEAQAKLAKVESIRKLDDGERDGLQQEILIAPSAWLATKPDKTNERPLGIAWATERLGEEFGRIFWKKHAEWFSRVLGEFYSHRDVRVAWMERNLRSVPDWLLHPLMNRISFSEGPLRRERSGMPEELALQTASFGSGPDALEVKFTGMQLGHLPDPRRPLRFYRQSIPREYSGPVLRRQEYVETRFLVMELDEHVRQRFGNVSCHVVPAEQPSLVKTTVKGKPAEVWDMRFITLGQLRADGMCAMLGLGFRPDDAELVSIRPCFLPFSVAAITIPELIPMLIKAAPVN